MRNKLTRQITFEVASVVFGGTVIYGLYQALLGDRGPMEFMLKNIWFPVLLTIVVYGFLSRSLRHRILQPLDLISYHARDISRGVFEHFQYPKTRNEIDQLTSAMNSMATHLDAIKQVSWKVYSDSIKRHLAGLQKQQTLPEDVQQELLEIEDNIRKLELNILEFKEAPALVIKSYGKVKQWGSANHSATSTRLAS